MTTPEFVFALAVLCVGLPSAFTLGGRLRNLTALALSLSWGASEAAYYLTGEGMSPFFMWIIDVTVIAAILAKNEYTDLPGWRNQISPWDRAVLAIFPVAWLFYVVPIDPYGRYWALYILALAQFALASWEVLHPWLLRQAAKLPPADNESSGLELVGGRGFG